MKTMDQAMAAVPLIERFQKNPRGKKGPDRILPPDYLREKKRREAVRRLALEAAKMDDEFGRIFPNPENSRRMEILNSGREIDRQTVGDAGVNAITRRTYEGTPPLTAYVKPQSGESGFRYDAASDSVIQIKRHCDKKTHRLVTTEQTYAKGGSGDPVEEQIVNAFRARSQNFATLKQNIADYYGLAPDEIELNGTEFTPRYGVDRGKTLIREYTASRLDRIFNLGVVPLTALRAENEVHIDPKTGKQTTILENIELVSVQEAAPGKALDAAAYREILAQGPKHPGAKSFMRIACLDYLMKSLDRHNENILYDPATQQFSAIDNGLSMGLSQKGVGNKPGELDPLRSIPLSVVLKHANWKLDPEAMASLKQFHDKTLAYLQRREELLRNAQKRAGKPLSAELIGQEIDEEIEREQGGQEFKYLTKLFRMQYGHEKVAQRECLEFIIRLRQLLQTGRPPDISEGWQGGEILPVGVYWPDAA